MSCSICHEPATSSKRVGDRGRHLFCSTCFSAGDDSIQIATHTNETLIGLRHRRPKPDENAWPEAPKFWDEYKIQGPKLGEGAFGAVFKVKDRKGNLYAVKVLMHEVDEDTSREVDMLIALSAFPKCHQGVVCYYGKFLVPAPAAPGFEQFQQQLLPAVVMEFIDGPDLLDWFNEILANTNQTPAAEGLLPLLETALKALAYVHDQGIAHRDLKPDNIMLRRTGFRKRKLSSVLVDFGLACNFRSPPYKCEGGAGTADYFAPELFTIPVRLRGADFYSKADVFSLGATFFVLFMGRMPPWEGEFQRHKLDTLEAWRMEVIKAAVRERSTVRHALANAINDMLEPDPNKRPSAHQALENIAAIKAL